jgi:predicted esterase
MFPGGKGDENKVFDSEPDGLKGVVKRQADQHGFVLLSINAMNGSFGMKFTMPPGKTGARNTGESAASRAARSRSKEVRNPNADAWSEQSALQIIDKVTGDYHIDRSRIYLMGNSGGEVAAMHFAEKFPEHRWCAIAPSGGPWVNPAYRWDRLTYLTGMLLVHGELDKSGLEPNREIAAKVRATGVQTTFLLVPGGAHITAWYMALPQTFEFFDAQPCKQ